MFEGINWTYWALSAGLASCIGTTLLAYNAIALVMFMREDSEGPASGLAKGAWAVGLTSLFLSGLPCLGVFLPFIAIILGRIERGRIYRDDSPLSGATPVRMGTVNAWIAILLFLLMTAGTMTSLFVRTGG
jgi:hypothetical protein